MTYLVLQILAFMLAAVVLGFLLGLWMTQAGYKEKSRRAWRQNQELEAENSRLLSRLESVNTAGKADGRMSASEKRIAQLEQELAVCRSAKGEAGASQPTRLVATGASASSVDVAAATAGSRSGAGTKGKAKSAARPRTLTAAKTTAPMPLVSESGSAESAGRPAAMTDPAGEADDLKRIKGIGPVIEKKLNELGIYHYRQIAQFNRKNVAWVDGFLSFKGRIDREEWVHQAKKLASK